MKILTLNTHSLAEKDYENGLACTVRALLKERPDIMAFQEVNQETGQPPLAEDALKGYVPCTGFAGTVRRGNHAARLAALLEAEGCPYFWTWLPVKLGYGIYDEGLALFSRSPIKETDQIALSRTQDYGNWKTRKALGIRARAADEREDAWFYTVHMGWWDDGEEPFKEQWDRLESGVREKRTRGSVWAAGDFNSPANVRGQGYDYVKSHGWKDTYETAGKRDEGLTVQTVIDGWRERGENSGMRIDYIWCSRGVKADSSRIIFDGKNYPRVSDHCGIILITGKTAWAGENAMQQSQEEKR